MRAADHWLRHRVLRVHVGLLGGYARVGLQVGRSVAGCWLAGGHPMFKDKLVYCILQDAIGSSRIPHPAQNTEMPEVVARVVGD